MRQIAVMKLKCYKSANLKEWTSDTNETTLPLADERVAGSIPRPWQSAQVVDRDRPDLDHGCRFVIIRLLVVYSKEIGYDPILDTDASTGQKCGLMRTLSTALHKFIPKSHPRISLIYAKKLAKIGG
jgi:hypothetical protein